MGVCFSGKRTNEVGFFVMDITQFIKLLMTSAILVLDLFLFECLLLCVNSVIKVVFSLLKCQGQF